MKTYLRHILFYFENVIHPAAGMTAGGEKRKRKSRKSDSAQSSPESFNLRGGQKKQDKSRLNPAP